MMDLYYESRHKYAPPQMGITFFFIYIELYSCIITTTYPLQLSQNSLIINTSFTNKICAVSSMDRVADFESVGWGFESLTACQRKPLQIQRLLGFCFATKSINHPISHSLFNFKTTNKKIFTLAPKFFTTLLDYM